MDGDEGLAKVDAVANIAHQHNPRMELLTYQSRFRKAHLQNWNPKLQHVVFLCSDSRVARKSITNVKQSAQLTCHARFCLDVIRLVVRPMSAIDKYHDAMPVRIGVKSFSSERVMDHIAASFMVLQFLHWLRSRPFL